MTNLTIGEIKQVREFEVYDDGSYHSKTIVVVELLDEESDPMPLVVIGKGVVRHAGKQIKDRLIDIMLAADDYTEQSSYPPSYRDFKIVDSDAKLVLLNFLISDIRGEL